MKYLDSNLSGGALSTGSINPVSNATQGNSDTSRIGDQLVVNSIEISCDAEVSTVDINDIIRFTIIQWVPDSTIAPTLAQIYASPGAAITNSPFTHDNSDLVRVLWDHKMPLSSTGMGTAVKSAILTVIPNRIVKFSAGTSNGTNQIYLIITSNSTLAPHPLFNAFVRVNFYDP